MTIFLETFRFGPSRAAGRVTESTWLPVIGKWRLLGRRVGWELGWRLGSRHQRRNGRADEQSTASTAKAAPHAHARRQVVPGIAFWVAGGRRRR